VLDGGSGNDLLVGHEGKDKLTGGSGFDVFSFVKVDGDDHERLDGGGNPGQHTVMDFHRGQDKLEFGAATDDAGFFHASFDAFDSNNDGQVTGADAHVTDNWLGMNIDHGEVLHQVLGVTAAEGYRGPGVDTVGVLGVHSLGAGDFVF
jgi:Ca2+-binding RTX toxin-like protein